MTEIKAIVISSNTPYPLAKPSISSPGMEAYLKRSDGTWSYGKHWYAVHTSSIGIRPNGDRAIFSHDEISNRNVQWIGHGIHRFTMRLNTEPSNEMPSRDEDEDAMVYIKEFHYDNIVQVPAKEFEEAKKTLGDRLKIRDEEIKVCFSRVFNTPDIKRGINNDVDDEEYFDAEEDFDDFYDAPSNPLLIKN